MYTYFFELTRQSRQGGDKSIIVRASNNMEAKAVMLKQYPGYSIEYYRRVRFLPFFLSILLSGYYKFAPLSKTYEL